MTSRMSVLGLAAACLLVAAPAHAAQSSNVSVVSQIPVMTEAISINFIGETMFVSTVQGIYSYNVSDPSKPPLRGALPCSIGENEGSAVAPVRKLLFVSGDPRGFTTPATSGATFPV